jgi:hypothetical protein
MKSKDRIEKVDARRQQQRTKREQTKKQQPQKSRRQMCNNEGMLSLQASGYFEEESYRKVDLALCE